MYLKNKIGGIKTMDKIQEFLKEMEEFLREIEEQKEGLEEELEETKNYTKTFTMDLIGQAVEAERIQAKIETLVDLISDYKKYIHGGVIRQLNKK